MYATICITGFYFFCVKGLPARHFCVTLRSNSEQTYKL